MGYHASVDGAIAAGFPGQVVRVTRAEHGSARVSGLGSRRGVATAVALCALMFIETRAPAGEVVRAALDPGAAAALQDGRRLFLECRPPKGAPKEAFLKRYLAEPEAWIIYKNSTAFAIRFDQLNPETQRRVLLGVFRDDVVDGHGWWHVVGYAGPQGQETLWSICEWVTGRGTTYRKVMADPHNERIGPALERGQKVLIPMELLLPVMRTPMPQRNGEEKPIDLEAVAGELTYGSDREGPYAVYRIKKGEALYTSVVVRFTDFSDNADILKACDVIQKRSEIKNVRDIDAGRKILIPIEMLSDRFRAPGSAPRREYEERIERAKRLRKERVSTKDLEGVVVVIDPGHGGRDQGCSNRKCKLYEDELNYDIACRVKRLLESQTQAKVHMTLLDPDQGFEPTGRRTFVHDLDEHLLTTPPYPNQDAKVSANLRWTLANAIYRSELERGTDPRKVVFTSFHTDALYNAKLRGAMVYIPGAKYRSDREGLNGSVYRRYKEACEQPYATSTAAQRRHDEAVSRNFAADIIEALGKHRIRRHLEGPWIRSQIRKSGGQVYVVAVLRNTMIPTKVLIECANIKNPTDCSRIANPEWRQTFAQAYVEALRAYYGS